MKKLIILLLLAATPTLHHDTLDGFVANEHIDWTDASADLRTSGNVKSGADDTTAGVFKAYGGGTGVTDGGCLQLHTAANYDTSINVYQVNVDEDNLVIKQGTTTKLTLSGATGNFTFVGAGHDSFSDFVANEHIDWTDTSEAFLTTGTATIGTLTLADGSITDSGGTIDFDNEILITDGPITSGSIITGLQFTVEDYAKNVFYLSGNDLIIENVVNGADIKLWTVNGVVDLAGDVTITGGLTVDTDTFVVDAVNHRVGIGTNAPDSIFHIKANTPGTVGSHPAGQLIIQDPDDTVFGNAVITGYESDGDGNPDQQLWYLGSSSGGNTDIIFLNRRNAKLALGTNGTSRITILGNGNVGINVTDPDAKLEVVGTLHISDAATFDGTLGAGAITGTSFITGGDIGVAGDTDLLQLAANALTVNGDVTATGIVQAEHLYSTDDAYIVDKLGVGRTPVYYTLELQGADTGGWVRRITDNLGTGRAPFLWFWRAQGTVGTPTAVDASSQLGTLQFSGLDVAGSGFGEHAASIEVWVDGVVAEGDVPGKLEFRTATGGTNTLRMTIKSSGKVGINDAAPASQLDVTGDINTTENYKVDDVQVVSNQQAHIVDAPGDTAANNATTINAILTALEAHGLLAAE